MLLVLRSLWETPEPPVPVIPNFWYPYAHHELRPSWRGEGETSWPKSEDSPSWED